MIKPSTLLVYIPTSPLYALCRALGNQVSELSYARTCRDVSRFLEQASPPDLVFTDLLLPDGSWEEVLAAAAKAPAPVNVIVVGHYVDTRFYVDVIERGAFDFIVPPFVASDLEYVVRCAADNVFLRQRAREEESKRRVLVPHLPELGL